MKWYINAIINFCIYFVSKFEVHIIITKKFRSEELSVIVYVKRQFIRNGTDNVINSVAETRTIYTFSLTFSRRMMLLPLLLSFCEWLCLNIFKSWHFVRRLNLSFVILICARFEFMNEWWKQKFIKLLLKAFLSSLNIWTSVWSPSICHNVEIKEYFTFVNQQSALSTRAVVR